MLSIKDLPIDCKLSSEISRKRILEEQRKERIFDARQRTIGLDLPTLHQQCQDNAQRRAEENRKEQMKDALLLDHARKACQLEAELEEERRKLSRELEEFWRSHQQPCTRSEFDVIDPHRLKKEIPARLSDRDPRCSVSGCQMLVGEDLDHIERVRLQKQQQQAWLKEQMEENKNRREEEARHQHLWDLKLLELDSQAIEMERNQGDAQRSQALALSDFNRRLEEEQRQERKDRAQQELQEGLQELFNSFYGDLLSENADCARSSFGPHRVVTDRWKGFSPEMKKAYNTALKEQIENNQKRQLEEKRREQYLDHLALNLDRKALLLERAQVRERRSNDRTLACQNRILQQEQQQDCTTETGPGISPEYFDQFNTSTR